MRHPNTFRNRPIISVAQGKITLMTKIWIKQEVGQVRIPTMVILKMRI